jgi:hypothetical protein
MRHILSVSHSERVLSAVTKHLNPAGVNGPPMNRPEVLEQAVGAVVIQNYKHRISIVGVIKKIFRQGSFNVLNPALTSSAESNFHNPFRFRASAGSTGDNRGPQPSPVFIGHQITHSGDVNRRVVKLPESAPVQQWLAGGWRLERDRRTVPHAPAIVSGPIPFPADASATKPGRRPFQEDFRALAMLIAKPAHFAYTLTFDPFPEIGPAFFPNVVAIH